tara:strand:- start:267 stop:1172 length:906 start_codon:yes stop_codon:yes gene_type:complete
MKIFDCITYFNEPMLFEIRLNILDKHVDEFIVAEASFTHSGHKKKINFNKDLYPKFKNRIKHLIIDNEPNNVISTEKNQDENFNKSIYRLNAAKRIEFQRNALSKAFEGINQDDWIIYSDSDEIPNLENINFNQIKKKFLLFRQDMFYYKFNLSLPVLNWYGSKACRLKDLINISELRNIKPKKYNWWRIDTFFKKNKFINIKIIENGGWHFTEIKTPKEIFIKHTNDEHHDEFDQTGIREENIKDMIKNRYIPYDHSIDQKEWKKKWNKDNRIKLSLVEDSNLPKYLIENKKKYVNWFDT